MYVPDIAAFTESGHKPGETVICTGKIKHVGSTYIDQWNYLKNLLPKEKQHEASDGRRVKNPIPGWFISKFTATGDIKVSELDLSIQTTKDPVGLLAKHVSFPTFEFQQSNC